MIQDNNQMKNKESKKSVILTDQPYVQNINLVTGDKFNYQRQLLSDREINQLCVDESKSQVEKFLGLLKDGQRIQKWSIFQNMPLYVRSPADATKIISAVHKNYADLTELLQILADGLYELMAQHPEYLSKENYETIYEMTFRTMTQNPEQVEDWSKVLQIVVQQPGINIDKCVEFTGNSFSMNAPPERRRVAFCMFRHLYELSKQIKKIAASRVLFFYQDQIPKTRYEICCLMRKLITNNPQDHEIWKIVWDYYMDKDDSIKDMAFGMLSSICYEPNFQILIQALGQSVNESSFCRNLNTFVSTYAGQIQQQAKSRMQIMSFINRVFKSKKIENICYILRNLTGPAIAILGEANLYEDVAFGVLLIKSREIVESLISFYHLIEDLQFRQNIKTLIIKSLKQLQYEVYGNSAQLAQMFDLSQEQEISTYLAVCNKLLESSKWYCLVEFLEAFPKLAICQPVYEKICQFMLKLWMSCPTFMLDKIIECVIYLILINKRSLQFLIMIREKILNSKFWQHRKNYIFFYAAIKSDTSFEFHKYLPALMYKSIVSDKAPGVRLTLLEVIPKIYKYTDPALTAQKSMIREAVARLQEDRDSYVKEKAEMTRRQIEKIDKDSTWLSQCYERNKQIMTKELLISQISYENKKLIKTELQISKSTAKAKKMMNHDKRKTVNLKGMHKEGSIDGIPVLSKQANSMPPMAPKRNNLFRCHSVKIKAPVKKV